MSRAQRWLARDAFDSLVRRSLPVLRRRLSDPKDELGGERARITVALDRVARRLPPIGLGGADLHLGSIPLRGVWNGGRLRVAGIMEPRGRRQQTEAGRLLYVAVLLLADHPLRKLVKKCARCGAVWIARTAKSRFCSDGCRKTTWDSTHALERRRYARDYMKTRRARTR